MKHLEFALDDLAAVRLLQFYAYADDLRKTRVIERGPKREALQEFVQQAAEWSAALEVPPHLRSVGQLQLGGSLVLDLSGLLQEHRPHMRGGSLPHVLLDAATSTEWPKGVAWATSRDEELATAASFLDSSISTQDVRSLVSAHTRSMKRIRKDSVSPGTQIGLGAVMGMGALLSGGAANVVGTAIGTHILGYSGAAATSAGLALLGGGSLASGGFGMAGGTLLIQTVSHGARSASRAFVGGMIARRSASSFISELAKLDVRCHLDPDLQSRTVESLHELKVSLTEEWLKLRPNPAERRRRIVGQVRGAGRERSSLMNAATRIKEGLPTREERNLATSIRAVDYEIRHLEAPEWKRWVSKVPRTFGAPTISKLLDRL